MTKKEFYNEVLNTFENTETKEEETLLYKITYSIAYTITRLLLCFFGQLTTLFIYTKTNKRSHIRGRSITKTISEVVRSTIPKISF